MVELEENMEESGKMDDNALDEEQSEVPSDNKNDLESNGDDPETKSSSWAKVMAEIIQDNKDDLILSKAKKISTKMKSTKIKTEPSERKTEYRRHWISRGRKKPDVLEKDKEKMLAKVAVKGVVHLFNAVAAHQQTVCKSLEKAGNSEIKKDSLMKKINKEAFYKFLVGDNQSENIKDENVEFKEEDEEDVDTWNPLKEDFMATTKLSNWDKQEQESADLF